MKILTILVLFTLSIVAHSQENHCGRIIVSIDHPLIIESLENSGIFSYVFEHDTEIEKGDMKIETSFFHFKNKNKKIQGKVLQREGTVRVFKAIGNSKIILKKKHYYQEENNLSYENYMQSRLDMINTLIESIKNRCPKYINQ